MEVTWFWKEDHRVEVPVSSHHISRVYTVNFLYHCWCWRWLHSLRSYLSDFSTIRLFFFFFFFSFFPYCTLWKKITLNSPHLQRESYVSRLEYLHKFFGILHETFVNSFPTYLFMQSFLSISVDSWIYNLYFDLWYSLVCCSHFSSFRHWGSFNLVMHSFEILIIVGFLDFLKVLPGIILIKCSRFILYISSHGPRISISPRNLGFFYWEMVLETKFWVLGMLDSTQRLLLLGPVS